MIIYDEPLYRPPSEARSLIIQATIGCSHNRCIFCGMYKSKNYRVRSMADIRDDIIYASRYSGVEKVFLADGDALSMETSDLLEIIRFLYERFPDLKRVTSYANPKNILSKSSSDLERLRQAGLTMVYYGIESGSDRILRTIQKGALYKQHLEALMKVQASGMDVSATIITGLGGENYSEEHITESARLVTETSPRYISTLSLMVTPESETALYETFGNDFHFQTDRGMLLEDRLLIERIQAERDIIFRSNHASNALALKGTLPGDRNALLSSIDAALAGRTAVRPEWMRGL